MTAKRGIAPVWLTSTTNDGNVAGYYYSDAVNPGLSHAATYHYDGVNRLSTAAAMGNSTYSQTFTYDAFGNLSCTPSGPGCVALAYNTATNHVTTSGYAYDAAGNLTGDGTRTYHWDAESHLTVTYVSGVAVQTNTYNALGQRVRDVTQTNTTDEAYGAGGELLWRYTGSSSDPNQRAFVPFGGGILAEYYSGGTLFDHPDELGSITASTSYNGAMCQERLFYPYGESWTGAGSCGMHQTFGKLPDYDAETDQYNTLARHYPAKLGRWLSPDWSATPTPVPYADLADPQSLNLYAYVRNNPTSRTDPDGHRCYTISGCLGSWTNGLFTSAKKLFGIADTPPPPPPPPPPPLDQEARTAFMAPIRPSARNETVYQIGGIVNAEAWGMKDSKSENMPLSKAREQIAEVRINGDQKWGDNVEVNARMAPPMYSGPDFQASLDAAANAAWNKLNGISLTGGATNYRMWKSTDEAGPFWNMPVYTTAGPYLSRTPYTVISTYGPNID